MTVPSFPRPLKQTDRVVVVGDTMALAGNRPHGFVTLLREALNYEEMPWFVVGRSTDRWEHASQRFAEEVIALRPTVLLVMLGLNDVWHQARGHVLEFEKTRCAILELANQFFQHAPQGVLVFASPFLIGEKSDGTNSLDRDLSAISDLIAEVAAEVHRPSHSDDASFSQVQFLNLRRRAVDYLQQHNPTQKPHSILTVDGIQLNKVGHKFMADLLADYFGLQLPAPATDVLRHVVFLKFKAEVGPAKTREVLHAFQALGKRIDVIAAIESGTNNSPEGLADGFTHVFTLTFHSTADRDIYLNHPAHQEFVQLALATLEKVCVLDYWAQSHPTTRT
ncbi:MAG: Dabb family protein [Planctomycetaceae bacterium]|nr:Dabb family protein [Planctomycetaceae bacterium]